MILKALGKREHLELKKFILNPMNSFSVYLQHPTTIRKFSTAWKVYATISDQQKIRGNFFSDDIF